MDREEALKLARRVGKIAAIVVGAGLLLSAATVFFVVRHFEAGLPSIQQLKTGYKPPQITRVLARDGTLLGSIFTERRTVIAFSTLPPHVKLAFLAAEDASFYEHEGLNYFGMLRAMFANLRAGGTRQGASTITQQVVKNLLLTPERTYQRKIRETILAKRLEQGLAKDEIFSLYLNHIYLGHGRYGVEEAARHYFGKHARDIDLAEAALLAGLVAAPERFSPRADAERALSRKRYVLNQMQQKGFVTRELADQALAEPLALSPSSEEESELSPELMAYARRLLETVAGEDAKRGGFTVHTTLDPRLQAAARKAVRDGVSGYAVRQKLEPPLTQASRKLWGNEPVTELKPNRVYVGRVSAVDDAKGTIEVTLGAHVGRVLIGREERYNPKHWLPSQFTKVGAALRVSLLAPLDGAAQVVPVRLELGPEAALVAVDARSRDVLALVGSVEAFAGGLDRATQSRRQPGSSFKPFLYGYALASRRFTPASVLTLPPVKGAKADAGAALEERKLSVRSAIAQSDNAAAEMLIGAVGAPNVVDFARSLGIESKLGATPSLALGAYEVTPFELANAYTSFANGGEVEPARLIHKIMGPDGKQLTLPGAPPKRRAISAEEAYLVTSLLKGVVQNGTAKRASSLNRPLAGKTGTTNKAKDAWFAGYSTEIVCAVWVGYDDALPLGWGESGATTALPIWISFMKAAHEGRPATDFPRPPGIVTASVDPASGLLAYAGQSDAIEEEFLDGTVPSETAQPAAAPQDTNASDDEAGEGAQGAGPPPSHDDKPAADRPVTTEAGNAPTTPAAEPGSGLHKPTAQRTHEPPTATPEEREPPPF